MLTCLTITLVLIILVFHRALTQIFGTDCRYKAQYYLKTEDFDINSNIHIGTVKKYFYFNTLIIPYSYQLGASKSGRYGHKTLYKCVFPMITVISLSNDTLSFARLFCL